MASHLTEEQVPLVAASVVPIEEDGVPSEAFLLKNHAKDAHILSFAFFFIFLAYGSVQNLESTVNTVDDLGTSSLGILYLSFTMSSFVASPVVKLLGSRKALLLGTTGYWPFVASNLKPSWYTMVPASIYVGFASAVIWVGQGTYLTCAAHSHAKALHLHEDTTIGSFNGEFWALYGGTQVIGNLVSLLLLRDGMVGEKISGTTLLFTIFLGSSTIGVILMYFLSERDGKKEVSITSSNFCSSSLFLLKSALAPLLDKQMLLIIPFLVYSGLEKAFVWSEFTKHVVSPAFGISGVGGAMALYSAFGAILKLYPHCGVESLFVLKWPFSACTRPLNHWLFWFLNKGSLVAGRFTSNLSSITLTIFCGAVLQLLILLWLLFKYSMTSGVLGTLYPLLMAAAWGVGDGVFNTQLNVLLGIIFRHDMESSFAQLKIWQCASTSLVFFLSPYVSFHTTLIVMVTFLFAFVSAFFLFYILAEKTSSGESTRLPLLVK